MSLKVIDTGPASPEKNMARDQELLDTLPNHSECLLHFYEWDTPSATYGYFSRPEKLLKSSGLDKHQLSLAKRPTGGGIIFHQFDMAFSVLVSTLHPDYSLNTLTNYRYINELVAKSIADAMGLKSLPYLLESEDCNCKGAPERQFCMAQPTVYDLLVDGKKVAGAAQRRTKMGYLHQGSISLQMPTLEYLQDLLQVESEIASAMQSLSFPLLGSNSDRKTLAEARYALKHSLINNFNLSTM